ncbi:MAG TPA: hypothetical protein VFT51_08435 [Bacillales bacterium]|nr:hypothetical protein [Bacillales bacterium]
MKKIILIMLALAIVLSVGSITGYADENEPGPLSPPITDTND